MFEKSLQDVVKGIRASKRDTNKYISQCIAEIKTEINSSDMFVKANALQKLTFLQMMGYSMNWASFATIEVMSSPRFHHKRIGYLAASQGFTQDTEVILLTTNLLKKELRGAVGGSVHGFYDAGLAINCISNIVTEDLAKDLLPELTNLTSHPQPYIRKKAVLCLFKLFVKYPQGLRLTFSRLQQCLDDANSSVVSCAVNVITELSDKNPKNYLHLAPAFFELLTKSSNNWMLIKVVKLLGSLVPEEPRLARKLLDPLASIVRTTQAKSLLYESVRTITLCLPYCRKSDGSMPQNVPQIVELCANTLLDFVQETDQNLKYLGLVGFGSLMQSHPRVLSDPKYRPLILECLSDQDVTIRTRALDLLTGMTSRKNLMELVGQLMKHVELASGTYKNDLVAKIVEMCSGEKYSLLQDFAWYLDVLFQLGHMRGIEKHGELLRAQVTDVALRVLPVRPYAVRRSIEILLEGEGDISDDRTFRMHMMVQILPAVAWVLGEYSDLIRQALSIDPDDGGEVDFTFEEGSKGTHHAIIQCLTAPLNTQKLPTATQKVFVQAAMKILAAASEDKLVRDAELEACVETIHRNLPIYMQSTDVEVVERSFSAIELLRSLGLTIGFVGSAPNLMNVAADEESSDEVIEEGDLLGMPGGAAATAVKRRPKNISTSSNGTLASKIRDASGTLGFLLKPSPMKPSGSKAQKKKRQTPIGVTVDLDAPIDASIFQDLIREERALCGNTKISLEAVSFTQQAPFKVEERKTIGPIDTSIPLSLGSNSPTDAATSFQKGAGAMNAAPLPRQNDPFYLTASVDVPDVQENASRFGMIQLLDSDEEQNLTNAKQKKKKAKKVKKIRNTTGSWGTGSMGAAIYESDDEDDNDAGMAGGRRSGPGKEFAGLAKVDLTAPLREDEVMPERTHRVVPERPRDEHLQRKKKAKKAKKKVKESNEEETVGDLLDLGAIFGETTASTGQSSGLSGEASSIAPNLSSNPIDSAFDLLADTVTPATAPYLTSDSGSLLSTMEPTQPTQVGSKPKRPWLKATVKSGDSHSHRDWSRVAMMFRVYRHDEGSSTGARVVVRVDNQSSLPLNELCLDLKSYESITLGTVASMGSVESTKFGPIRYSAPDSSQEVKGTLRTPEGAVPVKLQIPSTLLLSPESNISLEQLGQELAAPGWSSHSAKASFVPPKNPQEVRDAVAAFLRAELIIGSAMDSSSGSYAARSARGSSVRFLVKARDTTVKVDVKSTSSSLGKALASDIKKLVL